ncbi:hypothetical protein ACFQZ4_37900 [Catellatospora coxensis]|uniref:Uncharacterized protein n=1 Tax=Catellatospora coxensis TaxID=310354 RepID=A0A8J3KID8_9ACTN|nr:hypothetical protein [Catellatospora coxensis]GIG03657.1 hypothetical protein Cco03nite_03570 [Catellatospora coxensis]
MAINDGDDDNPVYPLVAGFANGENLMVWCLWCCVWHSHGHDPADAIGSVEHRSAHCYTNDSPYKESGGYNVQVSSRSFASVRKLVKEATPAQQEDIHAGRSSEAIGRLRSQPQPAP